METKGIIFDFFGVVCTDVGRPWYKNHSSLFSYEELKEKYITPYDRGDISAQKAWDALGEATGTSGDEVHAEWLALADVDSAKVTLIEDLKTRYSVALCSNGNADFFKSISDKHNIHGLFPITVISSDEKTIKPDPEIYQRTLNRMQLPPDVVIFIDDRPENLVTAKAMGMRTIHFTSLPELKTELAALGVR